jgi:hypothetical protein
MIRKLKWVISAVVISSIGFGIYFLNDALVIGTGYSAKYICSQVFLADRNPDLVFTNEIKPTHPLFQPIRSRVDYENKTVTSKAFGFWKPMTAVYREGCGCTLAIDTTREELLEQTGNISLFKLCGAKSPNNPLHKLHAPINEHVAP